MKSIFKYLIGFSMAFTAGQTALQAETGGNLSIDPIYLHLRETSTIKVDEKKKTETNSSDYLGLSFSGDYTFENNWKIKGALVASITDINKKDLKDEEGNKIKGDDLFVGSSSFALGREFVVTDQITMSPLLGINSFSTGRNFKVAKMDNDVVKDAKYVNSVSYAGAFTGFDLTYLVDAWKVAGEMTYGVANTYNTNHDIEGKTINTEYSNKALAHGPSASLSLEREIADSWTASLGSEYRYLFIDKNHSLAKIDARVGLSYRF